MSEAVEAKAKPVISYDLMVAGNKIGEFSNEMELAMACSRYIIFNGGDNTTVRITQDGNVIDEVENYWATKLADLFIFANKTMADLNVVSAKLADLQNKYKELKELVSPTAEPQNIAN